MNTPKRYLFGVLSTMLFAVGLARAAERFDPLTRASGEASFVQQEVSKPVESCTWECSFCEPAN